MTQNRNKIFEDFSQLMTNAMGVAQGARSEAETAMKSWVDRWIAERNLVTREEFEAVRAMAQKAREENEALLVRIAALEGAAGVTAAAAPVNSDELKPGFDPATGTGPGPVEKPAAQAGDPDAAGQAPAEESDHFERPDGSVQS